MRTDDLIGLLTQGAGPAPRALATRRIVPAMVVGLLASSVVAMTVIGLVPMTLFMAPAWWMKFGYAVLLAIGTALLAARLGRPAAPTRAAWGLVAGIALVIAALGVVQLMSAAPSDRMAMWMGHSWRTCPVAIPLLALPGLALVLWAMRGMAPTRPALAGLAGGLLAGAVSASGYALSCDELSMSFVATWYTLGIVLTGVLGALLGWRLLRW